MYFKTLDVTCRPINEFGEHYTEFDLGIHLECPHCKKSTDIPFKDRIRRPDALEMVVKSVTDRFVGRRDCIHCGVVSIMPPPDQAVFLQEAIDRVREGVRTTLPI